MNVLIAGGRGFLGRALARALEISGHRVRSLTRSSRPKTNEVTWDGKSSGTWVGELRDTNAIINACGHGLHHWPWTDAQKRRFVESRVLPGRALAAAIAGSPVKPEVFIQFSGINRYGLTETAAADETTPAGSDFLAQLTVAWEDASQSLEELGIRRVIVRNAIVLDGAGGLFPLMCLPARLMLGGRLGNGQQAVPWIHLTDHTRAIIHLLEDGAASGPFNLVAPVPTNNAELMAAVCGALGRPYWFHVSGAVIRLMLGELADLVLCGRVCTPTRLLETGFSFAFPEVDAAIADLLHRD